jgi:hypothetical protein
LQLAPRTTTEHNGFPQISRTSPPTSRPIAPDASESLKWQTPRLEKHLRLSLWFMPVDGETNVLHKSAQLTVAFLATTCPIFAFGQTAQPPQFFVVCASQPNQPTIYFSGVLQGPAAALAGFRTGFTAYLTQVYAYSGAVSCSPTNTAVNAQNFITNYSTAYRKAKKSVVDTGWTESALAATPVAPTAAVTRAGQTSPAAATSVASSGASSGGSASEASPWASVLGNIFGPGGGAGAGGGGCGGTATAGAKGGGAKPATGDGGAGCQSSFQQVSTTLTSVFANKTTNGAAAGEGAPKNPQPTAAAGGLGSAQAQGTKLVVYGCGRQDTRVACVTDLTNQNQKDTLVQAADVWKDTFIVDDRGDRHQRSGGFFLNVDGDQRQQLDISYGKTARFVLMFDGVQPKVDKVALRSTTAALDVEEIVLVAPNAGAQTGQQH